ncbi:hypothetical protein FGO68_gene16945 [Halteria grandinella]|uniref:Uncharacterized protein n=1 Tax=Halteria grandinella TaxID=5974 RepID=A0A8J8P0V3_HALGN|nr:hypothetical protein FGO68_gene16945 [Halteria grandinella]
MPPPCQGLSYRCLCYMLSRYSVPQPVQPLLSLPRNPKCKREGTRSHSFQSGYREHTGLDLKRAMVLPGAEIITERAYYTVAGSPHLPSGSYSRGVGAGRGTIVL